MAEPRFPPFAPWMDDAPLTPKIHNKRRSLSISSENSFDCQSLQRSLKRVRLTSISMTPGELRLQRDLGHAVLSQQWILVSDDEWKIPMGGQYRTQSDDKDDCMHETSNIEEEASNVSVTVTRDDLDPMELILRIAVTGNHATTLRLHFPRMYPHRPPTVRRIEYHQQQQPASTDMASSRWMAGNLTNSNWSSSSSSLSAQKLKRIIIAASPDYAGEVTALSTPETVVLTNWSPVSRLTDICEWLVAAMLNHDHCGSCEHGVERKTPTMSNCSAMHMKRGARVNDEDEKKDDDDDDFISYWDRAPDRPVDSSDRATEKNPSVFMSGSNSSRAEDFSSVAARAANNDVHHVVPEHFFPPNRFDLGYERVFPEQRLQEEQDSMDFHYND
jgi:hypothetical protein